MDYLQYYSTTYKTYTYEDIVLNLIINGLPSILGALKADSMDDLVLNLIINGLPSILPSSDRSSEQAHLIQF